MNQYDKTTQKKKAAVIKAALSLFEEKGCSSVSIKDIAKQAGVSQASIYNYFGSKDAVVRECATLIIQDALQYALEILESELPFPEKLQQAISICNTKASQSISAYFSPAAMEDTSFVQLLAEAIEPQKREVYKQYIELGKKENYIDSSIPTEMYLDFIKAINSLGQANGFYDNLEENTQHVYKLLFHGLLGK